MIIVGTSGWQYDSWKGRFYPKDLPKSAWLNFFSREFASVEVNNSFYRLPPREVFEKWRRESSPGFVMVVKASRFITHIKRLKDPAEPVKMFWERAEGLGDKLGPVLFQLPPKFAADVDRLQAFLDVLPEQMQAAFEFRDRTWDT
ncbi:MAG: DUF72 domain-containing protein, partial [Actinobacteria bacterium]|nr:DUF72 domain-containing protein [Actinomycetota bacterium]